MPETLVGVRDLKAPLSRYLRRVKAGESLVITSRGQPIGRLIPTLTNPDTTTQDARVAEMVAAGLASWSGQRFQPSAPVAINLEEPTIAELIIAEREASVEHLL